MAATHPAEVVLDHVEPEQATNLPLSLSFPPYVSIVSFLNFYFSLILLSFSFILCYFIIFYLYIILFYTMFLSSILLYSVEAASTPQPLQETDVIHQTPWLGSTGECGVSQHQAGELLKVWLVKARATLLSAFGSVGCDKFAGMAHHQRT